ncbi:MAG: WG repeat-containing protein [Bacteroidia bacterium]
MNQIFQLLALTIIVGCNNVKKEQTMDKYEYANAITPNSKEHLTLISDDIILQIGSDIGFVDSSGDTTIPIGQYTLFDSTNYKVFFIVIANDKGVVGINMNGQIMFDAYVFGDVQIDKFNEDLLRIRRNKKVGYINRDGKVVIPCQYQCAKRFIDGRAEVALDCEYVMDEYEIVEMKSEGWFYIDKDGNKITTPQ